jgi:hypothetical protein
MVAIPKIIAKAFGFNNFGSPGRALFRIGMGASALLTAVFDGRLARLPLVLGPCGMELP